MFFILFFINPMELIIIMAWISTHFHLYFGILDTFQATNVFQISITWYPNNTLCMVFINYLGYLNFKFIISSNITNIFFIIFII